MVLRPIAAVCLCAAVLTSCAHPNRISGRVVQRLLKNNDKFVLVFGSIATDAAANGAGIIGQALAHPTIRFVHQADRSTPEHLLWSSTVSNGGRFYAVLQPPAEMPYLESFYAEVGSTDTAFDRITFVRLREGDAPRAMYFGEIRVRPAQNRNAQGQTVVTNIQDDFQNAERELKRLYPRFTGPVTKAGFVRNQVSPAPARLP